ncbi:TetR/AcrR family transcriptional regulator [Amycolatopsis magusensis]|uniref:AcrR family transcriptional regulator n=1 Tax=Amycolatopsis magusensis TaxID=882444 RepID=A0ABS4PZU1_9PSEU|nr:TetR/AcrR family transcriptional regulator [Amycolatopsis magusensis]MBP2184947.1 AcrR family transcriptional regulator [Amycolatopsis magusensis]
MRGRADRILDAAGALLLRHGYSKLTIGDIAEKAGVGKGTVYLHWRAKQDLFEALFMRESIIVIDELLDGLRADPGLITPHRFYARVFEVTTERPLVAAVVLQDTELLGKLADSSLRSHKLLAGERGFELMVRYGLLRGDLPGIQFALQATLSGYFLYDSLDLATGAGLDLATRSRLLAHTIRTAFEPPEADHAEAVRVEPAAAEFVALYGDLADTYRKSIYSSDPG